ncbi:hypothetical protein AB0I72_00480 [Nocardiopsis sp. NPDC049922]|uniref:phage tail tube protein n=1 Tax=Nocardiopsis sp. NPDC049922 TaxID=3155157 RepID=UPI00340B711E
MAGNPTNVDIWSGADVFFDFTRTAPSPTDLVTAWDPLWIPAGLLNGDDGMTDSRDESSEDHFAWGNILVRTTFGQHKRSVNVVMLEDNAVTFELINPGDSTRTVSGGVITDEVYVPQRRKLKMGLELRDGDKIKRRVIDTVELGEVAELQMAENTMQQYNATLSVYPDGAGKLWRDLKTDPNYVAP